jgi:hypothetical protein
LLHRQWGVSATLPAEEALKPTLLKQIVSRFERATPLVELLNTPLVGAGAVGASTQKASVNKALFGLPNAR